jgi:uncharacterized protein (TIGR02246 family)
MKGAQKELEQRRNEWRTVVNAGDLESYLELVTTDVVWLPPVGSPVQGRDAFGNWLEPFFGTYDYDFQLEPKRVRIFEGWCAEAGSFTSVLRPKVGGEPQEHSGTYAVLWRLDEGDQTWRIERYVDGFGPRPGSSEQETSV